MTDKHTFISAHAPQAGSHVEWLASFQRAAADRFVSADVPGRKSEEWRFFDLRPIVDRTWTRGVDASRSDVSYAREAGTKLNLRGGTDLVVDAPASASFFAGGTRDLTESQRSTVLDVLGTAAAPYINDPFYLLNSASFEDAICVIVPEDVVVDAPIHVVFTAPAGEGVVHHPRLLVVAGRGSKFTIVEDYESSSATGAHFTNASAELVVGANANLTHVRVQRENAEAAHIGRRGVRVGAHARYDSVSVTVGARSARNDVYVTHEGDAGWSRIDGLAVVDDRREVDTHSVIDNQRPHCESHQLHKCVVADRGHAVFNGKIFVQKGAQRTDAYQLNRNLLLTAGARVDTKPQLEIFADDVKCTHGATVGQLDEEQVFYLTSRGISPENAIKTLTYAFAAEVIETIVVRSLADGLKHEALQRTSREEGPRR